MYSERDYELQTMMKKRFKSELKECVGFSDKHNAWVIIEERASSFLTLTYAFWADVLGYDRFDDIQGRELIINFLINTATKRGEDIRFDIML